MQRVVDRDAGNAWPADLKIATPSSLRIGQLFNGKEVFIMSDLTTVELLWLEKRIENRIRFGNPVSERMLDGNRRILSFTPGSIFAFVRWTSNDL